MRSLLQKLTLFFRGLFAMKGASYLCDTCKWDYDTACQRPERPNAKTCPDYKRR